MTKAEIERDRDDWKQTAESLQDELDYLNEAYTELENENFELTQQLEHGDSSIKDVSYFKSMLAMENLLTSELEEFMDYFMRWHNK